MAARLGDTLELDTNKREIVGYGISVFLNNLLGLAGILLIAYFVGALIPTLAMAVVLLLLRPSAGGAHSRSSLNCSLFGYLIMPLFGLGAQLLVEQAIVYQYTYIYLSLFVALLGIVTKAPYFTQEKPRALIRQKALKVRSLILTIIFYLLSGVLLITGQAAWSLGLATGLLMQGLMLFPAGIYFIQRLDYYTDRIASRIGGEQG